MGSEELKLKDPVTRTLMEDLAIEQPDRKVKTD